MKNGQDKKGFIVIGAALLAGVALLIIGVVLIKQEKPSFVSEEILGDAARLPPIESPESSPPPEIPPASTTPVVTPPQPVTMPPPKLAVPPPVPPKPTPPPPPQITILPPPPVVPPPPPPKVILPPPVLPPPPPAQSATFDCARVSATSPFYLDPGLNAKKAEISLRNSGNTADANLMQQISCYPQAIWLNGGPIDQVKSRASKMVAGAASQNKIPVFVIYNIPRHNSLAWGSGVGNNASYIAWVSSLAETLVNSNAWIMLEPDSLGLFPNLSTSDQSLRAAEISGAVTAIKSKAPRVKVFLDAGHSEWRSISLQADILKRAGISQADGFFTNVSNFRITSDEIVYGKKISALVGGKHFIIDTSRNGKGPNGTEWCNPRGRALGQAPTTQTNEPLVDAFLWIKLPGESDGYCNGGPFPGVFWNEYALELARNSIQ